MKRTLSLPSRVSCWIQIHKASGWLSMFWVPFSTLKLLVVLQVAGLQKTFSYPKKVFFWGPAQRGVAKLCLEQVASILLPVIGQMLTTTTTTVLRPFVWDYPGESLPEETLNHPPSWSSPILHQLLPSTTIHSILLVQIVCLAISLHNLCPCPLWSTSWSGALHIIFHTFLHSISVFFLQHMPIPSQPVLL